MTDFNTALKNYTDECKRSAEEAPMSVEKLTEGYLVMTGIITVLTKKLESIEKTQKTTADALLLVGDKVFGTRLSDVAGIRTPDAE